MTVTPPAATRADVLVEASQDVVLDGLLIDGRDEEVGAGVVTTPDARDVTVSGSELTDCGRHADPSNPEARFGNACVLARADGLRLIGNRFHDCRDCDFVRGGASRVTILGNRFDRAVRGNCVDTGKAAGGGSASCNHNDMVQISGGGPWEIARNRFGEREKGTAAVFVGQGENTDNRVHDVLVANNVFASPTTRPLYQVRVMSRGVAGPPQRVRIVNNTVLFAKGSGVRLDHGWDALALDERPLVANNVLGQSDGKSCTSGRWVANLVEQGTPCPGDEAGPAHLDAEGRPTAASTAVVGRADASLAPTADVSGGRRQGRPDRGAYQFRPQAPRAAKVLARSGTSLALAWQAVGEGKLSFAVRVDGRLLTSATARARLLRGLRCGRVHAVTVEAVALGRRSLPLRLRAATRPCGDRLPTAQVRHGRRWPGRPGWCWASTSPTTAASARRWSRSTGAPCTPSRWPAAERGRPAPRARRARAARGPHVVRVAVYDRAFGVGRSSPVVVRR